MRALGHERPDFFNLRRGLENVHLVDDDDDLLAPAPDLLEKGALGFREWTIG